MTRKTAFFEEWSWFKFNNLGLTLSMNLKFYTSVAKGLKLKVRMFWGLIPKFVEVTGRKLVEGTPFWLPPILNRVDTLMFFQLEIDFVTIKVNSLDSFLNSIFRWLANSLMRRLFKICATYLFFYSFNFSCYFFYFSFSILFSLFSFFSISSFILLFFQVFLFSLFF